MRGAGTYNKRALFALPRSYVDDIYIYQNGDTYSQVGRTIVVFDVPPSPITATFSFREEFWAWSSNAYTLDFMIDDSFVKMTSIDPPIPLPFNLDYHIDPATGRTGLYLGWLGFRSDPARLVIPSPNPQYWLPKPLP